MGRNKYSQSEYNAIRRLLALKNKANRFGQKQIRHELRTEYEFNISDFNEPGKAFGPEELDAALQRRAIIILDDATIADMKAKRARDRERDAAAQAAATPPSEGSDWQEAMKQWQAWEDGLTERKSK